MAHMIYDEKFLTYRQPAWHGLGLVIEEEIGAVEAGNRIHLPVITVEPVVTASGLPTEHKAIVGELPEGRTVFSVVSRNYHEITHALFAEAWDRCVRQHVETIGLLMNGAGLFITAKLPDMDVKGDEIACYIMAENWLTGTRATKVRKTPVRVVCMNTLQMSDAAAVHELRICHTKPAVAQLEASLTEIIARSTAEYQTLKEAFELLAATPVTEKRAREFFAAVYPARQMPEGLQARAAQDREALDQLAAWERSNGAQIEHRTGCYDLYAGDGRGALSEAAAGTIWGAYNAVAEYEQHRKKRRQAESAMFGAGKDRVVEAFDQACVLAGVQFSDTEE